MVLAPRFHFSQTEAELWVHITLPNVRIAGMEMLVSDQREFSFYCRPYLLRINLPSTVYDEDEEDKLKRPTAQYLPDDQVVICKLQKTCPGEEFVGLDLITTLLAAKPNQSSASSSGGGGGMGRFGLGVENQGQYGFLTNFADFFGHQGFLAEFPDLVELPDPDGTPAELRRHLREAQENAAFDMERYRVDLAEGDGDALYEQAMEFDDEEVDDELTDADNLVLQQLVETSTHNNHNRDAAEEEEDPVVTRRRVLKILDVLLALCYERRFTTGDFSVESHVMIRKLSACLSWFEEFDSCLDVARSFARRCLCFPYLRRWDLCLRAVDDSANLLSSGSNGMVKALLTLRQLLQKSQSAYLLNRLFIDDMCVFAQQPQHSSVFCEVRQELVDIFAQHQRLRAPGVDLVGWNLLVKKTAVRPRRKNHDEDSATTTAPQIIEITDDDDNTASSAAATAAKAAEERDFVEELD